ncbi:MAG: FkbM family methyltransferase [Nitrospiraceae bacterium]|nr:FkbM family methyltransferase [Nitrospiraceae bacterium]
MRIGPSSSVLDLATIFVVFIKQEYGEIPSSGIIIDIGAFAIYAAGHSSGRVYAFGPSSESYGVLRRNIHINNPGDRVFAYRRAITAHDDCVFITARRGPGNHISTQSGDGNMERAIAGRLEAILSANRLAVIDLLKMDCEGSEYGIIFSAKSDLWKSILRVGMEYRYGRETELIRYFDARGYDLKRHEYHGGGKGMTGHCGLRKDRHGRHCPRGRSVSRITPET